MSLSIRRHGKRLQANRRQPIQTYQLPTVDSVTIPYALHGSVLLNLRREDRSRDPKSKDFEERLPIRPLESGTSTAESRTIGFGVAFGRPVAGGQ